MQNKRTALLILSLIALSAMVIGTYLRLLPLKQSGHHRAITLAKAVIYNNIKGQVQKSMESAFPEMKEAEKKRTIEKNFQKIIRQNQRSINQLIANGTKEIEKNTDTSAQRFLLEADSYHFFGLTEDLAQTGKLGQRIVHGKYFDPLMLAPDGKWEPISLHPFLGYYWYRLLKLFTPHITLMAAAQLLIPLLAALSLIPFLMICYQLGMSFISMLIGSLFFMLAPFFAQRTSLGWYDTDVYSILFPLLIFLAIFLGIKHITERRKNILFALLASFLTGCYELFWHGWAFWFIIMLVSLPVVIILDKILNKSQGTKAFCLFFGVYLSSCLAWIILFVSPSTLIFTFQEGWRALNNFLYSRFDIWPNIFLTVGETQAMPLDRISFLLGGNAFFIYFVLAGILISLFTAIRSKDIRSASIYLLIGAFNLILLYLSLKAARFALLLTVPALLSFTLFIHYSYLFLKRILHRKTLQTTRLIRISLESTLIIVYLSSVLIPLRATFRVCSRITPMYNRTWEKVLTQIRKETPPNAIINTWWCPGHYITAVAKRRVTIDGATQHEPQTYWIANILLSDNENTAIGLLRMLNLSGNKALLYLQNSLGLLTSEAIQLLQDIAPLSESKARLFLLTKGFNTTDIETILRMTHGNPPPSYFLVNNDLIDAYPTLPYIGHWDFKKAEYLLLNKVSNQEEKKPIVIPTRGSKGFMDFILSLSGGLPSCSSEYKEISRDQNIIRFENGIRVDLSTKDCLISSPDTQKTMRPQSIFYVEGNQFKEKVFFGDTAQNSLLLYTRNNTYYCLLLDKLLAKSLLFRLYYLHGQGLNHFTPVITEKDPLTQTTILVYAIKWE
jgi:dolichyl-diphosphooligosaccharide--protein glycosyltransferase